ncbi:MAG: hypothetical protein C5B53_01410 [Candidatus Melainabacteria bacterium]|nr:MAG: hypothetical protein C5B53_01410 [Candidatus Melainabacteria bacterium]
MAQQTNYRIFVKPTQAGAFNLAKVLNAPRHASPVDVKAACTSFELVGETEDIPEDIEAFASFVMTDFFALAHRTGLYNRQRALWDAVGRINEILMTRPLRGLFIKVNQPFVDLRFVDLRGNTLIFGSIMDRETNQSAPANISRFVNKALERAGRIHKRQGYLFGVFLALPEEIPEAVQATIDRMTQADDPVARYESKLPPPISAPLNLLKIEALPGESTRVKLSLAHPNLRCEEAGKLVQAG